MKLVKIEIKIDESCREPKIIIVTDKMTEEINETVKRLAAEQRLDRRMFVRISNVKIINLKKVGGFEFCGNNLRFAVKLIGSVTLPAFQDGMF